MQENRPVEKHLLVIAAVVQRKKEKVEKTNFSLSPFDLVTTRKLFCGTGFYN